MSTQPAPTQSNFDLTFTDDELLEAQDALATLTPEAFLIMQRTATAMSQQLSAGVKDFSHVALVDLHTPHGDRVALTFRGFGPEVLDQVVATLRYGKQRYGLLPAGKRHAEAAAALPPQSYPSAPAPATVPPAQAPRPATPPPAQQYIPVTHSADPGAPADGRGNVPGKLEVEKLSHLEVTPLATGKAKVGLVPYMRNGKAGNFAKSYEQRPPAEWAQLFAGRPFLVDGQYVYLTEDHFKVAGQYSLPNAGPQAIDVEFVVSSNRAGNGTGNYYINLNRVLPPA